MILISVVGMWLGVVVIAVTVDVGSGYLADRKPQEEKEPPVLKIDDDQAVREAIARYRETKRNELGVFTIGQRPPQRIPVSHRKTKAVF